MRGWWAKGAEAVLNGDIDFDTDTLKVALLASTYTFNGAHDFYNDISGSVVGTPATLGSVTKTGGVLDAADVLFAGLTGAEVGALAIFKDTGNTATSPLLIFIDDYAGLPFTPDGSDLPIVWPTAGIMTPALAS